MTTSPSVAVVGGGILGLLVAERLQAQELNVTLIRMPDTAAGPSADTQRNHGWKQSGLLYRDSTGAHVLQMQTSGDLLLAHTGVDQPSSEGLFLLPSDATKEAQDLLDAAGRLGLASRVRELDPVSAARRSGKFHLEGRTAFTVPDAPFDEALVLKRLRRMASRGGVALKTVGTSVTLARSRDRARVVDPDFRLHDFDAIVLAAGAGTPRLLQEVDLESCFAVYQSALLVIPDDRDPVIRADLLADLETGLAVVRHGDAVVVGGRFRRRIDDPSAPRFVTAAEQEEILDLLPPAVNDHCRRGRWTSGYKTEHVEEDGTSSIAPWLQGPQDHGIDNLWVAVPGKATLAWLTADRLIGDIMETLTPGTEAASPTHDLGTPWGDEIFMHYSSHYSSMNDRRTVDHEDER